MSNRFRKTYRELSQFEKDLVAKIKDLAGALADEYEYMEDNPHDFPNQRMLALAMTKLEESVMWATKAITG